MRIPRSIQLFEKTGFIHKFWRCHNKEFYLKPGSIKRLYLKCVSEALKEKITGGNVFIFCYCAMDNHFHQVMGYQNGHGWLSRFMRQAHGLFGARYNRLHKRSGKVAEGRPKTPLIQNLEHLIRVHFYVEANPIRAGMFRLENLKLFKFSSYRFYAFGIKDEFSKIITIPEWYLSLGPTAKIRQQRYRSLFREYVMDSSRRHQDNYLKPFIGSPVWKLSQLQRVKSARKANTDENSNDTVDFPNNTS